MSLVRALLGFVAILALAFAHNMLTQETQVGAHHVVTPIHMLADLHHAVQADEV
jgi:hypothetical protein